MHFRPSTVVLIEVEFNAARVLPLTIHHIPGKCKGRHFVKRTLDIVL